MRLIRISLLLIIGLIVLCMVSFPGLYDSRRRALATRHYMDAPGQATKLELESARAADMRSITVIELFFAAALGACVYSFFRVGRSAVGSAELVAPPNGGPAMRFGNSGAGGGPPSVS